MPLDLRSSRVCGLCIRGPYSNYGKGRGVPLEVKHHIHGPADTHAETGSFCQADFHSVILFLPTSLTSDLIQVFRSVQIRVVVILAHFQFDNLVCMSFQYISSANVSGLFHQFRKQSRRKNHRSGSTAQDERTTIFVCSLRNVASNLFMISPVIPG